MSFHFIYFSSNPQIEAIFNLLKTSSFSNIFPLILIYSAKISKFKQEFFFRKQINIFFTKNQKTEWLFEKIKLNFE